MVVDIDRERDTSLAEQLGMRSSHAKSVPRSGKVILLRTISQGKAVLRSPGPQRGGEKREADDRYAEDVPVP